MNQSERTPHLRLNPSKLVENLLDCRVVVLVLSMQSAEDIEAYELDMLPSQFVDQLGYVTVILKQERRRLPPGVDPQPPLEVGPPNGPTK